LRGTAVHVEDAVVKSVAAKLPVTVLLRAMMEQEFPFPLRRCFVERRIEVAAEIERFRVSKQQRGQAGAFSEHGVGAAVAGIGVVVVRKNNEIGLDRVQQVLDNLGGFDGITVGVFGQAQKCQHIIGQTEESNAVALFLFADGGFVGRRAKGIEHAAGATAEDGDADEIAALMEEAHGDADGIEVVGMRREHEDPLARWP